MKETILPIGGGYVLRTIEVEAKAAVAQSTNRIAIFDRSGSMMWALGKVLEDLYQWCTRLPEGDTVTIGYFSGPGQYRFILKGVRIHGQDDLDMVKRVLNANKNTLSTTCFSEILCDMKTVIDELTPISDRFTLIFFTDGCPVVPNVCAEVKAIETHLGTVKAKLAASLFVGYGDYYNRMLMSDMARWAGGALVHADVIERFGAEMGSFTQATAKSVPMIEVMLGNISEKRVAVFTMSNGKPVLHDVEGTVRVPQVDGGNKVFIISETNQSVTDREPTECEIEALYGACVVLSRTNRADLALEILSKLGDANLANNLANAYTVAELGVVEGMLVEAATNTALRCVGGKKVGCVPKRDAFCVLDALRILADDEDAKIFPGNDLFQYRRIGVKTTVAEGFAKFVADKTASCPLRALVMHESRMNVSLGTKIPGTIDLSDECTKFGLAKTFPTFQCKNYTIIKDGVLNVSTIPCSMSKATFDTLKVNGAVNGEWAEDKILAVNLGALPVMNRAMADGKRSAKQLAEWLVECMEIEGKVKALKFYLELADPEGKARQPESILSEAAITYLDSVGVGRNGYQPKKVTEDATDTYYARDFAVTAKGMSSLPKVLDVVERRQKGKAQTISGATVLAGVELYEQISQGISGKQLAKRLIDEIATLNRRLRALRVSVQQAKFAVLLGNQWFEEFASREDCKLSVEGYDFTFVVKEVEAKC